MKLCINCYYCKVHCQCNYPQWCKKVNYCCEKCEAADSRIAEFEAQLAYERERNANNVANADYQIAELRAEITRLRAGGCAREQGATQYCAEAATWSNTAARYAEHIAKMDIRLEEARELLLQAHEPDQGQLRTQWDKDVDEWIKKAAHSGEGE